MKRFKNILFIFPLLFILSGCDLKYNVVINSDLTTTEELKLQIPSSAINEMKKKYGDSYIEESLETYVKDSQDNNYNLIFDKTKLDLFTAKRTNKSLIINEKIMKDRYNYYDLSCNDKYCLFYATADNNIIAGDGFVYDLALTIQVPNKVLENNADKVDLLKNEYTWYSKISNDNKDIRLVFLKEGINVPKRNKILYFITIGIFVIIGLVILIVLIKFISKLIKSGRP